MIGAIKDPAAVQRGPLEWDTFNTIGHLIWPGDSGLFISYYLNALVQVWVRPGNLYFTYDVSFIRLNPFEKFLTNWKRHNYTSSRVIVISLVYSGFGL